MKNNILILFAIILGLFMYYAYQSKNSERLLREELKSKDKEIEVLQEKRLPFINFEKYNDALTEKIKNTKEYKEDSTDVGAGNYLNFDFPTFTTDEIWYLGVTGYSAVSKATDTPFPLPGENIPSISQLWSFIIKVDDNGQIETLLISERDNMDVWNETLNQLPRNVLPEDEKKYYLRYPLPEEE